MAPKRGARTQNYRGEIIFVVLFAKMVLLAMVSSQGIKEPECSTPESVRKGEGKEMQQSISLMQKLRNLKHFIKISLDLTKTILFRRWTPYNFSSTLLKKKGKLSHSKCIPRKQHIWHISCVPSAHQEQQGTIPLAKVSHKPFISSWLCISCHCHQDPVHPTTT